MSSRKLMTLARRHTVHLGRALRSSDFGAGFGGAPPEHQIPGLSHPPATELIRVPSQVRSGVSVMLETASVRAPLSYRVSRGLRAAAERLDDKTHALLGELRRTVREIEAEEDPDGEAARDEAPTSELDSAPLPAAREHSITEPNTEIVALSSLAPGNEGDGAPLERGVTSPREDPAEHDLLFTTWNQRALMALGDAARALVDRARAEVKARGPGALRAFARAVVLARRLTAALRSRLITWLGGYESGRARGLLPRGLGSGIEARMGRLVLDTSLRVRAEEGALLSAHLAAGSGVTIYPALAGPSGWAFVMSERGEVGFVPTSAVEESRPEPPPLPIPAARNVSTT